MRRSDRQIKDNAQITQLLSSCQVLHLGLCRDGLPYVVPLNYGFEQLAGRLRLYFHSALKGKKVEMIGEGAACWVTITADSAVIRADKACDWSSRFASLMMSGRVRPLTNEDERLHGLDLIMRQHGFEGQLSYEAGALSRVIVYVIEVAQISGKQ